MQRFKVYLSNYCHVPPFAILLVTFQYARLAIKLRFSEAYFARDSLHPLD